jgi:hypothetical protein
MSSHQIGRIKHEVIGYFLQPENGYPDRHKNIAAMLSKPDMHEYLAARTG